MPGRVHSGVEIKKQNKKLDLNKKMEGEIIPEHFIAELLF